MLFSPEQESYIQHEVRLRFNDEKFVAFEKRFDRMDNKLNLMIGIVCGSIIFPVILHYLNWAS